MTCPSAEPNFVGVSLRQAWFEESLMDPDLAVIEIISEQMINSHGVLREKFKLLSHRRQILLHGLTLNIGGVDPLDKMYISQLAKLCDDFQPSVVSDHLCWNTLDDFHSHELLPLPYTDSVLQHIIERVDRVQQQLQRSMAFENITRYIDFNGHHMTEAEFMAQLHAETGCQIVLDITNCYINAINFAFEPKQYLLHYCQCLPSTAVVQFHVAGFQPFEQGLIDSHNQKVDPIVLEMLGIAWQYFPTTPIILEWDKQFPDWNVVKQQMQVLQDTVTVSRVVRQESTPAKSFQPHRLAPSNTTFQHHFVQCLQNKQTINDYFITGTGFSDAFGIYRQSIALTRLLLLSKQFPWCQKVLGNDYFEQVILRFIERHMASRHLEDDNTAFAQFLAQDSSIELAPYLEDLSQLEVIWWQVFHGENTQTMLWPSEPAEVRWCLNPNLQWLSSNFPLDQIVAMCAENYKGDFVYDTTQRNHHFIVLQVNGTVQLIAIRDNDLLACKQLQVHRSVSWQQLNTITDNATIKTLFAVNALQIFS